MARQNYSFGKRQRELAKKQKREEKMQRRLEKKANPGGEANADGAELAADAAGEQVEDGQVPAEEQPETHATDDSDSAA